MATASGDLRRPLLAGAVAPGRPLLPVPQVPAQATAATRLPVERLDALVARQVAKTPQATAVQSEEGRWSYAELWECVGHVSRALAAVPPGPIGILLPRGLDIAAVVLGVLRADRTVVSMDVQWPQERVATAAALASCAALVAQEPARWREAGCQVLGVADVINRSAAAPVSQPAPPSPKAGESIATILFTSGSTGQPKGVLLSHRYLTALVGCIIDDMVSVRGTDPNLRPLNYFSPSWMPFIDALYCPLVSGGIVTMYTPTEFTMADMASYCHSMGINWLVCVPALLQGILDEGAPLPPMVGVGGAPVPVQLARAFFQAGGADFIFGYSGTEQGYVTHSRLTSDAAVDACTQPEQVLFDLGDLRFQQTFCLVDDAGGVVSEIEQLGEIVVAGPGLFSGYAGSVSDPFWPASPGVAEALRVRPDDKVYRTKDLAKWTRTGRLQMTGRADSMVKVRGLRVDLGEVTEVLQGAPGVRETVVVVSHDALAAYVSPASAADPIALKAHCAKRLAKYMVPAVFKGIDAWPRLANGKIDKKALPPLLAERVRFVPPQGETEQEVARVWREVLGGKAVGDIGRGDTLEGFGATSIDVSLIVSRLRKAGFMLSIKNAYEMPTLQELASGVTKQGKQDAVTVQKPERWFTVAQGLLTTLLVFLHGLQFSAEYLLIYLTFGYLQIPFDGMTSCVALAVVLTGHLWFMLLAFIFVTRMPFMRLQPGTYRMYGREHLVLWLYWRLFDHCVGAYSAGSLFGSSLLSATDGTVWTNRFYKAVGATIGKNTVIDAHTGGGYLLFPHLVTIGNGCSLNKGTKIRTFEFRDGRILVKRVLIGDDVHLGAMSVVMPGAHIADGAMVGPLSVVSLDATVREGATVIGSPLEEVKQGPYSLAEVDPMRAGWPGCKASSACPTEEVVFGNKLMDGCVFLGLFATSLASFASLLPAISIAFWLEEVAGPLGAVLSLPVCSVVTDLVMLLIVVLAKPVLVGQLKPGRLSLNSWAYFRFWLFGNLYSSAHVVANSLIANPLGRFWLRSLGVKVGWETIWWIAEPRTLLPDLTDIGQGGFFGGLAALGTSVLHHGHIVFNRICIGDDFVVAEHSYVPPGCSLADGATLGAGACPHGQSELPAGTVWFGTPAIQLRVPAFKAEWPSFWMLALQLLCALLQVATTKVVEFVPLIYINYCILWLVQSQTPLVAYPAALSGIWLSSMLALAVAVLAWKWLVVGVFRESLHSRYSLWCHLRNILVILKRMVEQQLVSFLKGTPWILIWYRLLGAKVGKHIYLETLSIEECDLITIGDGAVVLDSVGFTSHSMEGGNWKLAAIKVGQGTLLETTSDVLLGATLQDGAQLGAQSVVMSNEDVMAGRWLGAPVALAADLPYCCEVLGA